MILPFLLLLLPSSGPATSPPPAIAAPKLAARPASCGPTAQAHPLNTARFTVVSEGQRTEVQLDANTGLVFCRTTSEQMTWVRLATSAENDGSDSAHLDIDLCNLPPTGALEPMIARAQPCPGGATWALWWHAEDGGVFANDASSTSCTLTVETEGNQLQGRFSCLGLSDDSGTGRIDIVDGYFECDLEALDDVKEGAAGKPTPADPA